MPLQDKLSIINECLLLTGQHVVAVADNGSREWLIGSAGYEFGLQRLLDAHDWKFAKVIETVVERDDSGLTDYADAYARPNGCIHVIKLIDETDWKIVGEQILVNNDESVTVEFIRAVEPNQFQDQFTTVLKHFIFAGIYRGLLQQPSDARNEEKRAEQLLAEARPRGDLEEPGRARFISSLKAARSARRG